jgi:hypothetical protein
MDPEQLLAEAVAATGLDDFGGDGFLEGLERNAAAFAKLPLTPQARAAARAKLVADLANRLRIENWATSHPAATVGRIEGPLLVCGLPRTGTTATVAMLALDPRFRFLRGWEATSPIPPPVAGQEDRDPRARAAREAARSYDQAALHLFDPDGPEEDLVMLAGLDMHGLHGAYPMPDDYIDWWLGEDFVSTYAYHERTLKVLQSQRPPSLWLLKAPPHIFKLEAFAARYPEARFVMTHRDPAKLVASVASLYQDFYQRQCLPGSIDKAWTGRRCLDFWAEGARRGLAARERIGDHRFIDVYNSDLVRDPIGTFEKLYDALGWVIDAELRRRLEAYHRRNAQGAFGRHLYTPEEYGLSEPAIRAGFRDYVKRFGL